MKKIVCGNSVDYILKNGLEKIWLEYKMDGETVYTFCENYENRHEFKSYKSVNNAYISERVKRILKSLGVNDLKKIARKKTAREYVKYALQTATQNFLDEFALAKKDAQTFAEWLNNSADLRMKANKKKEVVKMPRNLKKEYNWEKNKYYFIRARIPREMGEELKKSWHKITKQ